MVGIIALFQSDLKRVATVSARPRSTETQLFLTELDLEPD